MKWNYRIVRGSHEGKDWYGLYEVHYQDGRPWARTDWAVVLGDSQEDIVAQLETMVRAARELEVLDDNVFEIPEDTVTGGSEEG